jgi:hypothetical protein
VSGEPPTLDEALASMKADLDRKMAHVRISRSEAEAILNFHREVQEFRDMMAGARGAQE